MEIKTIETMAREYATVNRGDDTPDTAGIDLQRVEDFCAGAYAVLDEISQSVFTGNWVAFPIRNIKALRKKITLLKLPASCHDCQHWQDGDDGPQCEYPNMPPCRE